MNPTTSKRRGIAAIISALPALVSTCFAWRRKSEEPLYFANSITSGVHGFGCLTKRTDGAITTRYLIGKRGSDDLHVVPCSSSSDLPYCVLTDEAVAAEDLINAQVLGQGDATQLVVAGGTIAFGDFLVTDAAGKAIKLPTAPGTYFIIGMALEAAVANDHVEFASCVPIQRVVS